MEALQSEADLDYNNSSLVLPVQINNRSPFWTQGKPISIPSIKAAGIQRNKRKSEEREGERVNGEDSEGVEWTEKKSGMWRIYIYNPKTELRLPREKVVFVCG